MEQVRLNKQLRKRVMGLQGLSPNGGKATTAAQMKLIHDESYINLLDSRNEIVFVHDEQTKRVLYYMRLLVAFHKDLLLCGPVSCGKSKLIRYMKNLDIKQKSQAEKNIPRYLGFAIQQATTLDDLQRMVENNMLLLKNGNYAPPSRQPTVVFIDDLNLCKISHEYDVQSPAEIIRNQACYGGWYQSGSGGNGSNGGGRFH